MREIRGELPMLEDDGCRLARESVEARCGENPAYLSEMLVRTRDELAALRAALPTDYESCTQDDCVALCRRLGAALDSVAAKLPPPKGVFVSSAERHADFVVACRLLHEAGAVADGLRKTWLSLGTTERRLQALIGRTLRCRSTLYTLCEVGERSVPDGDALRTQLTELTSCATALWQDLQSSCECFSALRESIHTFCEGRLMPLCRRAARLADVNGAGEHFDRSGFLSLCGELRTAYLDFEGRMNA